MDVNLRLAVLIIQKPLGVFLLRHFGLFVLLFRTGLDTPPELSMVHLLDVSCQGRIVTRVWPSWPAPDKNFLEFAIAEID